MEDEPETTEKHVDTLTCPWCNENIDLIEEETVIVPYRKKQSTKKFVARKSAQTTL